MQSHSINPAHLRESMVGEEDPGAALDVVASMLRKNALAETGANSADTVGSPNMDARIHLSCSDDGKSIDVGVTWPRHPSSDAAKLLGLVVANHSAIADTAWSLSGATGLSCIELDVDEDTDGVFYVSRRDC